MDDEQLSFEDALARLQVIVDSLDDDSLSLEESIELYEEGMMLSKQCTETLEEAQLRIENVHEEKDED